MCYISDNQKKVISGVMLLLGQPLDLHESPDEATTV